MDEAPFAYVNPHVAECPPQGVEKHQITWLEFGFFDRLRGMRLLGGTPWQQHPQTQLEGRLHKTAAVEALVDRIAAQPIGCAQKSPTAHREAETAKAHRG